MSGIVGIYQRRSEVVEPEQLSLMIDTLIHRGADGKNAWHRSNVGMGHLMLWTTPESLLEKLPFEDHQTDTVITADARIDNRQELISLLNLGGDRDKITDSSLILKAYHKWGVKCPARLIGDFAFAIWDARQRRFFCARDPMGIKPFYYYCSGSIFAFASEIKALLCLPEVEQELNELRVAYQLAGFFEDQEITFYKNIWRLKSAHSLVVNEQSRRLERYWALDPDHRIKLGSDQEYTAAFKELFTEAVNCRLRSAFPVGSTLSGGLDSSSITCTARNLLSGKGKQLHTFSAIFPNLPSSDLKQIDERYFMDAVKQRGKIKAHDVRADLLNPLLDWLWQGEEPILSPNIYIHEGMYDCARQNGVRVFLDGVDGDTTVSHGWRYLTHLTYTGNWSRLYQEITAASSNLRISRKLIGKEYCIKPLIYEPLQRIKERLLNRSGYGDLIDSSFAQKMHLGERIRQLASEPLIVTAREEHRSGLNTGLYPYAMEITDKATAPKSIEARYPFFDRRLMEFCLAIPLEQKFRQGYPRAILRHAMAGILPPEIQWRVSKARLGSNFSRNFVQFQKPLIEKAMCSSSGGIAPYVNRSSLNDKYQRYVTQDKPLPGDDLDILNSTLLSLWLEHS
ncbi:MAG: lasso peptide isopeptide bond-forming cyclase [Cyanobacteria bacterium J06631_2]